MLSQTDSKQRYYSHDNLFSWLVQVNRASQNVVMHSDIIASFWPFDCLVIMDSFTNYPV